MRKKFGGSRKPLSIKHGSLVVNITGCSMIYIFQSKTQWSNYLPQRAEILSQRSQRVNSTSEENIESTGKYNSMVELFTWTSRDIESAIQRAKNIVNRCANITQCLNGQRYWVNAWIQKTPDITTELTAQVSNLTSDRFCLLLPIIKNRQLHR